MIKVQYTVQLHTDASDFAGTAFTYA